MMTVVVPAPTMVSLSDAKLHLRVDQNDDDTLIDGLIGGAQAFIERFTRRWFGEVAVRITARDFASIVLPPDARSVNVIQYRDTDNVNQVLPVGSYEINSSGLCPTVGNAFPAVLDHPDAIELVVLAGVVGVPADVRCAALLLIGDMYENREGVTVGAQHNTNPTVDNLLYPWRAFDADPI